MKAELSRCKKLISDGFSLITVSENKIPNIKWKKYQTEAMTEDEFDNFYNLPNTAGVGIITGHSDLEVIDVDLKVFATVPERETFWKELISFLKDNIYDFEQKFVIVKTRNAGYHIIYRCTKTTGNKKIAVLENMTEAVIESRGVGGYVWIYDNFVQGKGYNDVKYIDEEDREILWNCCQTFNYEKESFDYDVKKIEQEHYEADVKPWVDYNDKTDIWDLISSEFSIVKKLSTKIAIKRNGAKSPHSGYIFDNSRCMYLFSTGTIYPHEKLLTPFHVYTYQKFNGDFSAAAKQLYKDGFGSRVKREMPKKLKKEKKPEIKTDEFPIEVFPENLQKYIVEVKETLNASYDYLGSALLWVISLCIGNSMKIEIKKGWIEAGVVWIAIVGRAGIGKSHNIDAMVQPLSDLNKREIRRFAEQVKKYNDYKELTKKEKELEPEVEEPIKSQFIVGDITLESFFDYHEQNPNGIGILRDELSGWIKDLNKYREGSDLETYLSCWSNQQIILTRKMAKSAYVPKAFVPIMGGVQPKILSQVFTPENKDNGFIDRWLLCYPDMEVERYNDNEMSSEILEWYSEYIKGLYDNIKNNWVRKDEYDNQLPNIARFAPDAKKEWIRIFNKITDLQNSESENEYMKSILPKQKSYVARFALLLNCLYHYDQNIDPNTITVKSVTNAEKLSDYYIKMAKKNKMETMEDTEIRAAIKSSGKITAQEQFIAAYTQNPELNRSKMAENLNVSRSTIKNWIKQLEVANGGQ